MLLYLVKTLLHFLGMVASIDIGSEGPIQARESTTVHPTPGFRLALKWDFVSCGKSLFC